jgi:restriction system protein
VGAIHISTKDFYDDLIDLLGVKSGLVLDRADIIALLKEDEGLSEFAALKEHGRMRIRSEVYESVVEYLLFRLGRLEQRNTPFAGAALFHKYKGDPEKLAKVNDIGEAFTKYLESVLARGDKSIDPIPFVEMMRTKHGLFGAHVAIGYVDSLHAQMVRSPWGLPVKYYEDTIELKELFESEGLSPLYGKFIDQRYIDFLHRNFERIDRINWRKFEGLTGEFFHREGFHVEVGPGRNDDGVDLRLWPDSPESNQPPTVVVQCKRQKAAVEKVIVKALYADIVSEKARSGLIVTTSRLSVGAKKVLKARQYPIGQADRPTLRAWVKNMRKPGAGSFL